MTLGAFSAVVASSLMYPFGLVKSRIIMQGMSGERLGMIGIVRKIIINEGYGGFYKGFIWSFFSQTVSKSMFFTIYGNS